MSNKFSLCMKRILAAALLLSFTAGLVPVQYAADSISMSITANAAGDEEETESDEFDCTFVDGVLTISAGTYNNPKIPQQDKDGNNIYQGSVNSVVTNGDVKITGDCNGLFGSLFNVTSLDLSQVDTTEVTDMKNFFAYDYDLKEIKIGDKFKTANVTDMSYMFYSCYNLESFDFSGFDTSKVTDMSYMFEDVMFEELDLSGFDTSNVTNMNHMFERCEAKTINLSGWNTSKVENMYSMFQYCYNVETIDISSFNTINVTDMGYMFDGCNKLTSLDVSSFKTGNVTNMSNMFNGCGSLTSLDVSGFDTSKVKYMEYMFSSCGSLTSLDVSGFDTSEVTEMYDMFNDCSSLTELDVSGFDTSNVTDMNSMFYRCRSLKKLDLSNFTISEDNTSVYNMFTDAGIEELKISDNVKITSAMCLKNSGVNIGGIKADGTVNTSANILGWTDAGNSSSIVSGNEEYAEFSGAGTYKTKNEDIKWSYDFDNDRVVTLISGYYSTNTIRAIHDSTEDYCDKHGVERVYSDDFASVYKYVVNDGVKFRGDCCSIFYYGGYYTGYYVEYKGDIDTSEVTNMQSMFTGRVEGLNPKCIDISSATNVTEMFSNFNTSDPDFVLDLSNLDTSNVTDMSYMFQNCNVKEIKLGSAFDTSNVENMSYMFRGSTIETIDISNFVIPTDSQYSYSQIFQGCPNLTSVKFPASFNPTSMSYFFSGCTSLKSFDFNSIDCSRITDVSGMFSGCSSLESVTIPEMGEVASKDSMFKNCTSLKSVDISGLNSSNNAYFSHAFEGCTSLESVKLPEITHTDAYFDSTFKDCPLLETVNLENIKSQNVHVLDSMFKNCSSIKEIDLSNAASSYDSFSMRSMFSDCTSLESVILPAFSKIINSSNEYYFKEMFSGAENLQSITFSGSSIQNNKSAISASLMLDNSNYLYTGWHYKGDKYILSGSGTYAEFSVYGGSTYVRDKKVYDNSVVKGASLTLEGQIGLNFYLQLSTDLDDNAYVVISGPKGEQKTLLKDAQLSKTDGYKFTYKLSAKQIHDKVTLSVYDSSGNIQALYKPNSDNGYDAVDNNKYSYAVSDYISAVQSGTGYSDNLVKLVNAIEAYGSYAQLYFNYKTDTVNIDSLAAKDDVAAVTADTVSDRKYYLESALPDGLKFKGYSLILDSETSIRFYFESENIEKYFTDKKLVKVSDNNYYFEESNIAAKDLINIIYFEIPTGQYNEVDYGDGDVYKYEVKVQMSASPMSYVYSALAQYGSNEEKSNLCNTMRALWLYSNAAYSYFYNN